MAVGLRIKPTVTARIVATAVNLIALASMLFVGRGGVAL